MIDWIKSLFCKHDWKLTNHGRLIDTDTSRAFGNYKDYYCGKCLKHKRIKWF